MHGYVGWCSGIDGFLITLISGSLQKGSEPFLYSTPCRSLEEAILVRAFFKKLLGSHYLSTKASTWRKSFKEGIESAFCWLSERFQIVRRDYKRNSYFYRFNFFLHDRLYKRVLRYVLLSRWMLTAWPQIFPLQTMEAGTGKYEGTYECMAVAAVPGVLGQPTGACDGVISLFLDIRCPRCCFALIKSKFQRSPEKLRAFDYSLCPGSGEFDL